MDGSHGWLNEFQCFRPQIACTMPTLDNNSHSYTDLTHEYTLLMDEFGYTLADVARIARNSFTSAMLPIVRRAELLAEFDAWAAATLATTDPSPATARQSP
jgi:adenosine deaminase